MRGTDHWAASSGRFIDGLAIARSTAASIPFDGGGTFESQAMLTNVFRPFGMLIGVVEGEPEDEREGEVVKETELSAVDLMQKPGEGERETRVVAAI